jgi:hypothetical protein
MTVAMLAAGMFFMSGCETVKDAVGKINLDVADVAGYVDKAASAGVKAGLKKLSKDEESWATTKTIADEAKKHLAEAVLPLFEGADVKDVTKATADQALALINDKTKVNPKVLGAIQLGIDSALLFLDLPDNPTDKIPDDQRKLLVALFKGIVAGVDNYLAWGGPASGERDMGPPVTACAWKAGGERP